MWNSHFLGSFHLYFIFLYVKFTISHSSSLFLHSVCFSFTFLQLPSLKKSPVCVAFSFTSLTSFYKPFHHHYKHSIWHIFTIVPITTIKKLHLTCFIYSFTIISTTIKNSMSVVSLTLLHSRFNIITFNISYSFHFYLHTLARFPLKRREGKGSFEKANWSCMSRSVSDVDKREYEGLEDI